MLGFTAGVVLLVLLQTMQIREPAKTETARLPWGFLAVIGIDLLIDGLLVGVGAAVSTDAAVVLTIALTVEVLFLGLAIALQLRGSGVSAVRSASITAALSLLVALGALLGAVLLAGASNAVLVLVLAFAAAALLWLVVEELLVEAHETPQRPLMAVMFFVGFLALYAVEGLG